MTAGEDRKKDFALATQLGAKIALRDISILGLEAKLIGQLPPNATLNYDLQFNDVRFIRQALVVAAAFFVQIPITFSSARPADSRVESPTLLPLANIKVGLRLQYDLDAATFNEAEDDAAVEHFIAITGGLHMWPYVRSEVQQLSTKLSLPPLVLPILRATSFAELKTVRSSEVSGQEDAPA